MKLQAVTTEECEAKEQPSSLIAQDNEAKWQKFHACLREHFGEAAFRRWFASLAGEIEDRNGHAQLTMALPTRFMRDWVEAHYGDTLRALWNHISPQGYVEFSVASPLSPTAAPTTQPGPQAQTRQPLPSPQTHTLSQTQQAGQSAQTAQSAAPQQLSTPPMMPRQAPAQQAAPAQITGTPLAITPDLDARFTFDNFVVGKPNELAYAAARRVAETEDPSFNPLFLYGGVGLGKTHLMHAIAWHIRTHFPHRQVIYMSAEKFMCQFVRALRFKDTVAFKEQFRSVDVLMIDDVQFICGKDTTQEEFFHTFNALVDRNRQVIISADKSPQDLDQMEERLRSRLGWGLVADIHPATYELRLGILHAKAEKLGCAVPDKVMEFLAHKIASNVRELEGALNRIIAHAQLVGRTITLEMTQEVLADLLRASERHITIDEIQKKVAEHYNIRVADMHSARRARQVARPRQVAMYLAKALTPRSLPEIGRKFGGRDHTTVIHAVRKVEELAETDPAFRDDVDLLRRLLQN